MKLLTYITTTISSLLLVGILWQIVLIRRKLPSLAWTLIMWAFILFVWRRLVTLAVVWQSFTVNAFLLGGEITTLVGLILFLIGLVVLNDALDRVNSEAKTQKEA